MKRTSLYLTLAVGGLSPFISLSGFAATGVDVLPAGPVKIGGQALHHAPPADRSLPQGGTVTHGAGNVAYGEQRMDIHQHTPTMVTEWKSFDVAAGHTVQFHQPSPQAFAMNKVTGPSMSLIAGTIKANGRVGLINQNGIAFLDGALIDTNGFIASTLDMNKERFIHHGELFFEATPGQKIPVIGVFGDVTFGGAGLASFVGPFHQNGNLIASEVHLVTADQVTVSVGQSNKVRFQVKGALKAEFLDNMGTHEPMHTTKGSEIKAERVYLTARTVESMVDQVIHLEGNITAKGAHIDSRGEIVLDAGPNIKAHISGTWQALNGNGSGGIIEVLNSAVIEDSAIFNVSGLSGGNHAAGGLFLGVDRHFDITSAARLRVNPLYAKSLVVRPGAHFLGAAYGTGEGSRMLFIAENLLQIEGGTIFAPYDTGRAPFIEVSTAGISKGLIPSSLNIKSRVLRHGKGFASGTFMIDPKRLDIGPDSQKGPLDNFATIKALNALLKDGNYVVLAAISPEGDTPNKIVFHDGKGEIVLIDGGILSLVSHKLELNGAFQIAQDGILILTPDYVVHQEDVVKTPLNRPLTFKTSVSGTATFSRKGGDNTTANLILNYAGDGSGNGDVLPAGFTVHDPVKKQFQTMIYSADDVQFIRDNLSGSFSLANGRTVFAAPFAPIAGIFTGSLDGLDPLTLAPSSLVDLNITKAVTTFGDGIGRSGFFEKIGDGFIRNVEFLDPRVRPTGQAGDGGAATEVGVVAARLEPTEASEVPHIENVHVKWENKKDDSGYHVTGIRGDNGGSVVVGGMFGVVAGKAKVEGSSVRAQLEEGGAQALIAAAQGGGGVQDGDIVIGVSDGGNYSRLVGGFAGDVTSEATIARSFVEGITIRAMPLVTALNPSALQSQSMVGGFTSSIWETAKISQSWAGVTVVGSGLTAGGSRAGGFIGFLSETAQLDSTYSWGAVSGLAAHLIGDNNTRHIGAIQQAGGGLDVPSDIGVSRILLANKNKFAQYVNFEPGLWTSGSDTHPPYFPQVALLDLNFSKLAAPAQPAPQPVVEAQGGGGNAGQAGGSNAGSNVSESVDGKPALTATQLNRSERLQGQSRLVRFIYRELSDGTMELASTEQPGTLIDLGSPAGRNYPVPVEGSILPVVSGLRTSGGNADYAPSRINLGERTFQLFRPDSSRSGTLADLARAVADATVAQPPLPGAPTEPRAAEPLAPNSSEAMVDRPVFLASGDDVSSPAVFDGDDGRIPPAVDRRALDRVTEDVFPGDFDFDSLGTRDDLTDRDEGRQVLIERPAS